MHPARPPADSPVTIVPAQAGEALRTEAHRNIGEHQPVSDGDQRHRKDNAGDCDHGRRRFAAISFFLADRFQRRFHLDRLPAGPALRSCKSDMFCLRRAWPGDQAQLDQ